ncbi:MAG: hypothetical protein AB9907_05030 [Flexilinea sp.]
MKRVLRWLTNPAFIAALLSLIIMSYVLLLSPLIGLADNGDFERIIYPNGIYHLDRNEDEQFFDYFISRYGIFQYYNENQEGITTTQSIFIKAALRLNSLFTTDKKIFDIRFLALIMIIYFAVAIFLLVNYVTHKKNGPAAYISALLCIYFFVDTGYISYFNSFYAEGLVLVSFIFSIACGLLLIQRRSSPYLLALLMLINVVILTFAKQQNAPIGVFFAILFLLLSTFLTRKRFPEILYIKKPVFFRWGMLLSSILLCVISVIVYLLIPAEFENINKLHSMTRGTLMTSENPEDTLEFFNIDRQFALLNNSIYYERYPAIDVQSQMVVDSFFSKYGYPSIAAFYLINPDKLFQMLNLAAESAYTIRPEMLGNYEKSSGFPAGTKTRFFSLHSTIKNNIIPRTAGFIVIWILIILVQSWKDYGKTIILGCAILIGLSQIGVAIIGAGDADISKHLFLYNLAFDLVNYLAVSALLFRIQDRIQSYRDKRIRLQ